MSDAWEKVGEECKKCVVGTTVHKIDGRAMNFTRIQVTYKAGLSFPKWMNFLNISEGGGGVHFRSKKLKFWSKVLVINLVIFGHIWSCHL